MRFEIPVKSDYDEVKATILEYLDSKLRNKHNNGIILTRLQEDKDLFSEEEVASHGTMPKTGAKIMTANKVCDLSREQDKYKASEY